MGYLLTVWRVTVHPGIDHLSSEQSGRGDSQNLNGHLR